MDQIRKIMRPTDVPDTGLLCDLLWSDPDKDVVGWGENGMYCGPMLHLFECRVQCALFSFSERGVSFTFGADVVSAFLKRHDLDLICRAHQVVEDGYDFFAKRQLVTLFSAPNYCGEFDNAGAMMSVDDSLMCSFQILKPTEKNKLRTGYQFNTPPQAGGYGNMSMPHNVPGGMGSNIYGHNSSTGRSNSPPKTGSVGRGISVRK